MPLVEGRQRQPLTDNSAATTTRLPLVLSAHLQCQLGTFLCQCQTVYSPRFCPRAQAICRPPAQADQPDDSDAAADAELQAERQRRTAAEEQLAQQEAAAAQSHAQAVLISMQHSAVGLLQAAVDVRQDVALLGRAALAGVAAGSDASTGLLHGCLNQADAAAQRTRQLAEQTLSWAGQDQPWLAQRVVLPQFAAFVQQAVALAQLHALVVEARVQMRQSMERLVQCNTQQLAAVSAAAAPAAFDGASADTDLATCFSLWGACATAWKQLEETVEQVCTGVAGSRFSGSLPRMCVCKPFMQVHCSTADCCVCLPPIPPRSSHLVHPMPSQAAAAGTSLAAARTPTQALLTAPLAPWRRR